MAVKTMRLPRTAWSGAEQRLTMASAQMTAAQAAAEAKDDRPALACPAAKASDAVKARWALRDVAELPAAVESLAGAVASPRREAAEMPFDPALHSVEWSAAAYGRVDLELAVAAPAAAKFEEARAAKDIAAECRAEPRSDGLSTEARAPRAEPGTLAARFAARAIGRR
jgi:hypothetical protein